MCRSANGGGAIDGWRRTRAILRAAVDILMSVTSSSARRLWLVVALLIALQPLLHMHPVAGGPNDHGSRSAVQCVLCVHAHADVAAPAVAVGGLTVLDELLIAAVSAPAQRTVALLLPSRAPPAA